MTFAPRPVLTFAVGVVGHRPGKLRDRQRIQDELSRIFEEIDGICGQAFKSAKQFYAPNPESGQSAHRVRILTGFAEGTDQIAAETAPAAWEVEAILPAAKAVYRATFAPQDSSDGTDRAGEFERALERAGGRVVELPEVRPWPARRAAPPTEKDIQDARQASYERQARFLLKQVDLLVAVWDGEPSEIRGATGHTVGLALQVGLPVVWVSSNEARAPRLLARPDDVERDTETTLAFAKLQEAIGLVLRPPSADGSPAEKEARKRLETFYVQERQNSCWWTAYDCLKRGWRFRTWRFPIPLADLARVRDSWDGFLRKAPGGGYPQRIEAILLPRFHAADQIATHLSHAYRSAYVLAYFFSALTVLAATLGALLPHELPAVLFYKTGFVAVEFALITAIVVIVSLGRKRDWHSRWLDSRALAERLRHARILGLVGETMTAWDRNDLTPAGALWTSWYLRATVRELGVPFAAYDAAYQDEALEAAREFELKEQLEFNTANSRTLDRLRHNLHSWGDRSFFVTTIALGLFLAGLLYFVGLDLTNWNEPRGFDGLRPGEGPLAETLEFFRPWVTLFAVFLPALGAALAGIRFTGDFEGFAARSRETAERLEGLSADYDRALARKDFDQTAQTIAQTASVMAEDLRAWRSLYALKKPDLPA